MTETPPEAAGEEAPRRDVADVPWTIGDSLAVFGLWWLVIVGLGLALMPTLQRVAPNVDLRAPSLPVTLLILIGVTLLYLRRFGDKARRLWGARSPSVKAAAFGLVGGVVASVVLAVGLGALIQNIVDALDGQMPAVQEEFRQLAADERNSAILILSAVLIAPVAEETFFRGMFFPALLRRFSLWPAMGLSGSLFAVGHLQPTLPASLLVILVILPLGMLLAWLYHRFQTLVAPIAAHATFNLVNVLLLIREAQG